MSKWYQLESAVVSVSLGEYKEATVISLIVALNALLGFSQEYRAEPTEGALVMAAARLGLWKAELESFFPRVTEVPFDAQRKCMTTIHQFPLSSSQLPSSLKIPWQWYQQMGMLP